VRFRDAAAGDRDRILALRRRCFGDVDPDKCDPAFWTWEFETRFPAGSSDLSDRLATDQPMTHSQLTVGETDAGQIVTHLALIGVPHALDGNIVAGALAVDAMTAPEARGQGAFTAVVRHAMANSEHVVATAYQIRGAVLGAMLRGGWTIAQRVPVLMRPLLPLRRRAAAGRLTPRMLDRADVDWMSGLAVRDGCIARTSAFLSWRYFDNPRWSYRVTGTRGDAYLVTRRTTLKGFDTLAIVDLAFCDRGSARVLLRDAIEHARAEGCTLLAAFVSPAHPAFWLLVRSGFLPGPHWFRLLVHPPEMASRTWRVMWGDTDHL
jgi:GNAT superfamily N-acetyltransferase